MTKGSPSMVALLGLLAVAGYQNREKLSEMMKTIDRRPAPDDLFSTAANQQQSGGMVDDLRHMLTSAGGGGLVRGLADFMGRFTNPVQAAKAQTWVDTGRNGELAPGDLEDVLDDDTIADLSAKTGLGRTELLARLSSLLPDAIDQMTPEGRLPTEEEAHKLV